MDSINSIEASPQIRLLLTSRRRCTNGTTNKPYLYKTSDFGKTWKRITNGIPATTFTRVIREDPNKAWLALCRTETGLYVSFDDGGDWQSMQFGFPSSDH